MNFRPFKELVALGMRENAPLFEVKEFINKISTAEEAELLYNNKFVGKCYKIGHQLFKVKSIQAEYYSDKTNFYISFNIISIYLFDNEFIIKEQNINTIWFDFDKWVEIDNSYFEKEYDRISSLKNVMDTFNIEECSICSIANELNEKITLIDNFQVQFNNCFSFFLKSENENMTYEEYKKQYDNNINNTVCELNLYLNETLKDYYMIDCDYDINCQSSSSECEILSNENNGNIRIDGLQKLTPYDIANKVNKRFTIINVDSFEYDGYSLCGNMKIITIMCGDKYFKVENKVYLKIISHGCIYYACLKLKI